VEELHGGVTVGSHSKVTKCINVSPPQRGGAVPVPLTRGGPKWRDNYPESSDHPVTPNRLEIAIVFFKLNYWQSLEWMKTISRSQNKTKNEMENRFTNKVKNRNNFGLRKNDGELRGTKVNNLLAFHTY